MPLPALDDTITAIATAPGSAAVGIVRLSGSQSYAIADRFFRLHGAGSLLSLPAGRVRYGRIYDGEELIDEALLLTFRAPHSYTAEDVLELQCHGGAAVLRKTLELCQHYGARLAQPGEFTLRAYLNGRMDLLQAESVLALVEAHSDTARRNAALGLSRALSDALQSIQDAITRVYGNLQAVVDYPEEGVPEADFIVPLEQSIAHIDKLLTQAKAGNVLQHGARLALIGKPNAGKSSLLNALLGYQRSLVSDIPGTTRDYLEAPLSLAGIPLTAIDTAGIRASDDLIEASGVERAKTIAANADLSLLLIDQSSPLSAQDFALLGEAVPARSIVVCSKADRPPAWSESLLELPSHVACLAVSAHSGQGLEQLKDSVRQHLLGELGNSELWLSSDRQVDTLRRTRDLLERALHAPDDLAALDLADALQQLAALTGRGDIAEETLEHIFANFCVGK